MRTRFIINRRLAICHILYVKLIKMCYDPHYHATWAIIPNFFFFFIYYFIFKGLVEIHPHYNPPPPPPPLPNPALAKGGDSTPVEVGRLHPHRGAEVEISTSAEESCGVDLHFFSPFFCLIFTLLGIIVYMVW
jgi:hypothetical protein